MVPRDVAVVFLDHRETGALKLRHRQRIQAAMNEVGDDGMAPGVRGC